MVGVLQYGLLSYLPVYYGNEHLTYAYYAIFSFNLSNFVVSGSYPYLDSSLLYWHFFKLTHKFFPC